MGMRKDPNSVAGKIRAYIAANPKATAKKIAEAIGCKVERVYAVQHNNRKKARTVKAEWRARKKVVSGFNGISASDLVNRPAHYTTGGIETINFIEAKLSPEEFRGYLKGNVLKYSSRLGHKGDVKTDAGKLAWYSSRLQKVIEKA